MKPWPEYIQTRIDIFDKLHKEHEEKVAAYPRDPIKVTLPDGKVVEGTSWETTPYQVASGIRYVSNRIYDYYLWKMPE